jgi:hypothetical protein
MFASLPDTSAPLLSLFLATVGAVCSVVALLKVFSGIGSGAGGGLGAFIDTHIIYSSCILYFSIK